MCIKDSINVPLAVPQILDFYIKINPLMNANVYPITIVVLIQIAIKPANNATIRVKIAHIILDFIVYPAIKILP